MSGLPGFKVLCRKMFQFRSGIARVALGWEKSTYLQFYETLIFPKRGPMNDEESPDRHSRARLLSALLSGAEASAVFVERRVTVAHPDHRPAGVTERRRPLAQRVAACAEGLRLAPSEPKPEQCAAGACAGGVSRETARAIYRAMVAADEGK